MINLFTSQAVVLQSVFIFNQSTSRYFVVCTKVDQSAGQLSLPHVGITK